MRNTISIPSAVVATITVVAATTGFASGRTAGATTPVERTAASAFCSQVNAERTARGLNQLRCTYDGGAQAAVAAHTDSTAVWVADVPNAAAATIAFMQSADHRWWLMDPTATTIDIGVSCVDFQAGDGWTEHLMDVGANLPEAHGPDGAPTAGYVTQPSSATPCGAATPSVTSPPATAPPTAPGPQRGSTSGGSAPPTATAPTRDSASTMNRTSESVSTSTVTTTPARHRAPASSTTIAKNPPQLAAGLTVTHRPARSRTRSHSRNEGSEAPSSPLWKWCLSFVVVVALLAGGVSLMRLLHRPTNGGEP